MGDTPDRVDRRTMTDEQRRGPGMPGQVSTLRRLRVFGLCKLRVVQKVGVASFRATKESGEKDT